MVYVAPLTLTRGPLAPSALSEYRGVRRLGRGARALGIEAPPRLGRGATKRWGIEARHAWPGATSVGESRRRHGLAGRDERWGFGGPFRGPPFS